MAAAAQQTVTIIGDLPIFKGKPLPKERGTFKPGPDVRVFLRSLDHYFVQNGITDDGAKLRILFSRISKESGDAVNLMNMYVDNPDQLQYEQVQTQFLAAYPNPEQAEVQVTAKKIKNSSVTEPSYLCGLTKLEAVTRIYVETLLTGETANRINLNEDTQVHLVTAARPTQDHTATQAGDQSPAGATGGARRREPARPAENLLPVKQLIQNVLIKFVLETQLEEKCHKKISDIPLNVPSTELITKTLQVLEREKLRKDSQRKTADSTVPEVLFKVDTQKQDNMPQREGLRKCYVCNQQGHLSSQCKKGCKYCKKTNHTEKTCQIRIKRGVPYCDNCSRIGHLMKDCRKGRHPSRNGPGDRIRYKPKNGGYPQADRVNNLEEEEANYGYPEVRETDSSEDSD